VRDYYHERHWLQSGHAVILQASATDVMFSWEGLHHVTPPIAFNDTGKRASFTFISVDFLVADERP